MGFDALGQVWVLPAYIFQDLVAAYDAALHFVQENLAPEFPGLAYLAAGDDLSVLLKETQDLLGCRYLLAFEDEGVPPARCPAQVAT